MKRNKLVTAIASLLLGASLVCTGMPASVSAATVSADVTEASSNTVTSWTYNVTADPGTNVYLNVYAGSDHTVSENAGWSTYKTGDGKVYNYISWSDHLIDNEDGKEAKAKQWSVNAYSFTPGTYNVEIAVYNAKAYQDAYDAFVKAGYIGNRPIRYDYYSYQQIGTIKVATPLTYSSTVVSSTSVQLVFDKNTSVTGYEVYRGTGKKKVKLATTTRATYTDKGLSASTTYKYSIRPYYVDKKTKAVTYGEYTKVSAKTLGSAMNLKCTLTGSKLNKVKLSWNKVKGAKSYNIYRLATRSDNTKIQKGESTNYYSTYELLKTVKAKTKSYTDKSVESGMSYGYVVEAVLGKDSKAMAYETISQSFIFGSPNVSTYTKADGSVVATWDKVYGASGYNVYKQVYDATTAAYRYQKVKAISKSKTSYTFKAPTIAVYGDDITLKNNKIGSPRKTNYNENDDYGYYVVTVLNDQSTYTSYATEEARDAAYEAAYAAYENYQKQVAIASANNSESYIIRAYKGKVVSGSSSTITVNPSLGVATGIKAKATSNGIMVSWNAIKGANYYRVFRMTSGATGTNSDKGTVYSLSSYNTDTVTDYVGVGALKPAPLAAGETEQKYYQNYQYASSYITGTSVLDYAGQIATSNGYEEPVRDASGNIVRDEYNKTVYQAATVSQKDLDVVGPQKGVEYQYYVVGYYDAEFATDGYYSNSEYYPQGSTTSVDLYRYLDTTTNTYKYTTTPLSRNINGDWEVSSNGVKAYGKAVMTSTKAPAAAKIKKVASDKTGKKVTVTLAKAPSKLKATECKIYRSTKKKGAYTVVGTTKKAKFVDTTVKKGTTYYYKVVAVKANEAKADVQAKASNVKGVKTKGSSKTKKTSKK